MRLVDDDGNWVEISDLSDDDVLDIIQEYEALVASLKERITTLEGDIEFYQGEIARNW